MNAPGRHACPTCDRAIDWSEEFPFRPFCSDRCRLVDLGAWLNGQHAIPGDPVEPGELPEFGSDADERS